MSKTHDLEAECLAYTEHMNNLLKSEADLSKYIPVEGSQLFSVVKDGVLLTRLVNAIKPGSAAVAKLNKDIDISKVANPEPGSKDIFKTTENQNIFLEAVNKLGGVKVVNIGAQDIIDGKEDLILGLVWQIIRAHLLQDVNILSHPELIRLLKPGESIQTLLDMGSESLLLRWYQPGVYPVFSSFSFSLPLLAENTRLQAECQTMQKEIDSLAAQLSLLEQKVAQGEFDPSKTKVLHLTMNPERMAQEERAQMISGLKSENEQLAKRIQELLEMKEGKQSSSQSLPPLVSDVASTLQKSQLLEKKLQETELKMQRLKEIFGRKITEFREVCYTLTGFKIEVNDNLFKLSSMFAEREADFLMFQKDANNAVQFLETEYSRSMAHIVNHYLRRPNSIPAILSSLTLDLYEKQTFM